MPYDLSGHPVWHFLAKFAVASEDARLSDEHWTNYLKVETQLHEEISRLILAAGEENKTNAA